MRNLTVGGFIDFLRAFDPDTPCCGAVWVADDFLNYDDTLTVDEIREVVRRAEKWHDADIGYSWHYLQAIVEDVIDERE